MPIAVPRRLQWMSIGRHWQQCYGVFPLPDSDSYTDSGENGNNNNVQKCFQWTYSDSYACTDSHSNGYCTHFGTDISTDKVEFN